MRLDKVRIVVRFPKHHDIDFVFSNFASKRTKIWKRGNNVYLCLRDERAEQE